MSTDTLTTDLDTKILKWKELISIRDQMVEMGVDTAGIMSQLEAVFKVEAPVPVPTLKTFDLTAVIVTSGCDNPFLHHIPDWHQGLGYQLEFDEETKIFSVKQNGTLIVGIHGVIQLSAVQIDFVVVGTRSRYMAIHSGARGDLYMDLKFRSKEAAGEIMEILRPWDITIDTEDNASLIKQFDQLIEDSGDLELGWLDTRND